jgi:PleD family two-component response regulator
VATALEDEFVRLAIQEDAEVELVRAAVPPTRDEREPVPEVGEVVSAKHVLVIEDDEALRSLYAEILADEGYRTTLLSTAPGEPGAITAVGPDLILLDLAIGPTRDSGWNLLAHLKARPDTAAIPALVCS